MSSIYDGIAGLSRPQVFGERFMYHYLSPGREEPEGRSCEVLRVAWPDGTGFRMWAPAGGMSREIRLHPIGHWPEDEEIRRLVGDMYRRIQCADCKGTGKYQGFWAVEDCRTCSPDRALSSAG